MTIVESAAVIGGVEIRVDVYVAAATDDIGNLLGVEAFPATPAGCQALVDWLAGFGPVSRVGIEATGSCGAGVAGHLRDVGVTVVDVDPLGDQDRPGEAVPPGAVSAARAARSGAGRQLAASCDTALEAIGALMAARNSAERHGKATVDQIRALVAAAPRDLALRFAHCTTVSLVAETAALRPRAGHPVGYATRVALRELGQRASYLDEQIGRLDELMIPLVAGYAAGLLSTFGEDDDGAVALMAAIDDGMGISCRRR